MSSYFVYLRQGDKFIFAVVVVVVVVFNTRTTTSLYSYKNERLGPRGVLVCS